MSPVNLNLPLRYRYEEHTDIHYACEVGRFGLPTESHFLVIFYNARDNYNFALKPFKDGCKYLENIPEKRPWKELSQVPVNAWFRKKDSLQFSKISVIKMRQGYFYFVNIIEPCDVKMMFNELEYTLDNPLDKNAKWHFCGTET